MALGARIESATPHLQDHWRAPVIPGNHSGQARASAFGGMKMPDWRDYLPASRNCEKSD
jgi:hypothetical protein